MGIYVWTGTEWVGGRGTLTTEPVYTVEWAGAEDASQSILLMDGVEIRRNLQPRCRTVTGKRILGVGATSYTTAGWGGTAPTVAIIDDASAPSGSGKITRFTHAASGTTTAWSDLVTSEGEGTIPATASTLYEAGAWVRCSAALNVRLALQGLTAASASAGNIAGDTVTLAPNVWTLLTCSGTSSATVVTYRTDIDSTTAAAFPAGVTLDVDAIIIGTQPYFDGSRLP